MRQVGDVISDPGIDGSTEAAGARAPVTTSRRAAVGGQDVGEGVVVLMTA